MDDIREECEGEREWRKQGVTERKRWGGEMERRVLGRREGKEGVREEGGEGRC